MELRCVTNREAAPNPLWLRDYARRCDEGLAPMPEFPPTYGCLAAIIAVRPKDTRPSWEGTE